MENKNSVVLGKVSKYNNIEAVSEKNLALLEAPKESLQILESINLTHHIHKVQDEFNEKNKVVQLKQIFGKNVYLGSDIKKLCIMYDLKCPQAQYFKGEVGAELAEIINNFVKENTISEELRTPIKEYYYNDEGKKDWKYSGEHEIEIRKKCSINTAAANFFILAPAESFMSDNVKSMNATLFYRESAKNQVLMEDEHLIELHSWGNNYSSNRMLNSVLHLQNHTDYDKYGGIYKESSETLTIAGAFYWTLFIMLIFTLIGLFTNSMGFIYFNIFFAGIFLMNLLITSKSNLKHFQSWNQNRY